MWSWHFRSEDLKTKRVKSGRQGLLQDLYREVLQFRQSGITWGHRQRLLSIYGSNERGCLTWSFRTPASVGDVRPTCRHDSLLRINVSFTPGSIEVHSARLPLDRDVNWINPIDRLGRWPEREAAGHKSGRSNEAMQDSRGFLKTWSLITLHLWAL